MHIRGWLMAVATAAVLTGCVIRSGPGVSTNIPTNASGDTSGSAIVIVNNSDHNVCKVRFSPSSVSQWGPDRLGSSEQILPGQARGWNVGPGTWDVLLQDCSDNELARQMGVSVGNSAMALEYN